MNKQEDTEIQVNIPKEEKPVDITVPSNYQMLVERTLLQYKKWLNAHEKLIEQAAKAETEEEAKHWNDEIVIDFKTRYAGYAAKDTGMRLSPSAIKNIWNSFMRSEYRDFLKAHVNLTMENILDVGIDKFIYTMGWSKPAEAKTWRNNVIRVGVCCHCQDQFIPMIIQNNQGLCVNCRPLYSVTAMRNYVLGILNESDRYYKAHRDALMDFYILFYNDQSFRNLFMKGSKFAATYENKTYKVPEWVDHPGLEQGELHASED